MRRWIGALCIIGIGGLVWWSLQPATHHPGSHFNRGANAVWLGIEWVNEAQTEADIVALARDLEQRRQIRTVYVYASYLRPTGQFGATYAQPLPSRGR